MLLITARDLPETISVFPLPGVLLLPRARLPLHIFEPRYLAMIEECLKTKHRLIGMIQPWEPSDGERRLQAVGCAGRLAGFSETEDGRYMITLKGVCRFRVKEEVLGFAPYRRCMVDYDSFIGDLGPAEDDPGFRRDWFLPALGRYFAKVGLSTDWKGLKDAEPELLVNSLSMLCPFSSADKQALLEAPTLVARRKTLATLIEFALHSGDEETLQ